MVYLNLIKLMIIAITIDICGVRADEKWQNASQICTSKCSCSSKEGTFTLNCNKKDITQVLSNWPEDIKNETTVEAFFSQNNINRLEAMPGSNSTFIIYYDHCNITELGSGLFENTINVIVVDLSYNLLKGEQLHSDVFKGPYNSTAFEPLALEQLNLAYNGIHSFEKNLFEHMPNLKGLNLEGNNFRVIDIPTATAVSRLNRLEYLNLANNRLMHLPEELLKPLASLNVLDLSENQLTFVPLTILQLSKTLKKLVLDGNDILEFTDESFLGMESLVEVSAKNLKELRAIKTNSFHPLKLLRKLDLSGMNGSTNIEDAAIGNITNLSELNLSHSNLNWIPINFTNWTRLTSLDLRKNQLYCECSLIDIANRLSPMIKRDLDRPYCWDLKRHKRHDIYTLTEDVCFKGGKTHKGERSSYRMKIMRISLLMLSVVLLATAVVATWFCYKKISLERRSRLHPFASRVVYNPIISNVNL